MIFGTQFKQGEILIVPFPFSNLNSIKQRPNDCLLNGKIPLKSRIKVDKLFTLEKKLVKKKIGLVNVNILTQVKKEIEKLI
ncbi:MAG: hypothetical protein QT05_C0012G0003 [archaeon GW2011_AR13]|nr:MAG: hypothetical protein QT05_C0012G0003 [archaeon GW2011_AR13]